MAPLFSKADLIPARCSEWRDRDLWQIWYSSI